MPVVSLPLEEINRTILDNVYFKIVKEISDTIKLPNTTTTILYKDLEVAVTDAKPNATTHLATENIPTTTAKKKITASITEEYNEDQLTSMPTHQFDAFPIFVDNDINVFIYPIYVMSDVTIEFNYYTNSKSEANRIRDDIRIRLSQLRNIWIHDVEYYVLLPEVVEEFIYDVYTLKSRLFPCKLEDYFTEHTTRRVQVITDMANRENARIAIYEKQIRIPGIFDFSPMPEKIEANNDVGNYKLSFSYKISLNIPRSIVMRYPVMICNRPVPYKYLAHLIEDRENSKKEDRREINYNLFSLYNLSYFEAHRFLEHQVDINLPNKIPLFDEFRELSGHPGYVILTSFLVEIDETDKKILMNLRELEPYYIHETILQFILDGEKNYITRPYHSVFYFGLWQDERHFDDTILEIDNNLTVKSRKALSLVKPTRVTLSIIFDISSLVEGALARLLGNLDVLLIFLKEFIYVYRSYKDKLMYLNIADYTFFRSLITILYHFVNLKDINTCKKIMEIFKGDILLYLDLVAILYNNYPDMYKFLLGIGAIDEDEVKDILKRKVNYHGEEFFGMKTVFPSYIVALRREN